MKNAGFLLGPTLLVLGLVQGFFLSTIPLLAVSVFFPINTEAAKFLVLLVAIYRGAIALSKIDEVKSVLAAQEAQKLKDAEQAYRQERDVDRRAAG